MRRKVLMMTFLPWVSSVRVGSHQLARCFADAGWKIAFVSYPLSVFSLLEGITKDLRSRFRVYRRRGARDLQGRLWAYVPGALLPPHKELVLRSMTVHRKWHRATFPGLLREITNRGFGDVDLLYFDNPLYSFLLHSIRHRRSVLRVADRSDGFDRAAPAQHRLERELAHKVDLVVYTAQNLEGYVMDMKPRRALYLPNGVDFDHFAHGPRESPAEYSGMPRPIAIYVGAVAEWFDFQSLAETASRLQDVSFVVVGPRSKAAKRVPRLPNIHMLGARPYGDLPKYLHNADVGIIPFNVRRYPDLVNSVNPLKLYEYMACGLPVVATEWDALRDLRSPATLCTDINSFARAITDAIGPGIDREKLVSYAAAHRWEASFRKLVEAFSWAIDDVG